MATGDSVLRRKRWALIWATWLSFHRHRRGQRGRGYKQAIVDCGADDIVYSNLFTGVHGNYLKPSIENAGLDPNNLPESDPTKMDFGSGGNTDAKAWKTSGALARALVQSKHAKTAGEYIATLVEQYNAAKARIL